jgi:hypothetical protein
MNPVSEERMRLRVEYSRETDLIFSDNIAVYGDWLEKRLALGQTAFNVCENCKFWNISERYPLKGATIGICKRVKMFWHLTDWADEMDRVLKEKFKDDKAFVQDGSDYHADLLTLSNFGCNQFERKL